MNIRKCGLCMPEKPCLHEFCPEDTVLSGEYNALLEKLEKSNRLLERAMRLVEEHIDGSDETWSIARKRNKLVKEYKKGYTKKKGKQ